MYINPSQMHAYANERLEEMRRVAGESRLRREMRRQRQRPRRRS